MEHVHGGEGTEREDAESVLETTVHGERRWSVGEEGSEGCRENAGASVYRANQQRRASKNFKPDSLWRGDSETWGQGKNRGPDIATSSNIGHLRSLPRILPPPPLILAAPTTLPLSLSYYCQHDVTLPQYPCAIFPYLCLLLSSSYLPAYKNTQKRITRCAIYHCTLSHVDSDNKTVHPSIKHAVQNI